jgi:hypothetical protein
MQAVTCRPKMSGSEFLIVNLLTDKLTAAGALWRSCRLNRLGIEKKPGADVGRIARAPGENALLGDKSPVCFKLKKAHACCRRQYLYTMTLESLCTQAYQCFSGEVISDFLIEKIILCSFYA